MAFSFPVDRSNFKLQGQTKKYQNGIKLELEKKETTSLRDVWRGPVSLLRHSSLRSKFYGHEVLLCQTLNEQSPSTLSRVGPAMVRGPSQTPIHFYKNLRCWYLP